MPFDAIKKYFPRPALGVGALRKIILLNKSTTVEQVKLLKLKLF